MHSDFGYFEEKQLGKPYDVKLLNRLVPFVKPHRMLLSVAIFFVIIITLFDLALPYITKIAIDKYIVPQIDMTREKAGPSENRIRYLKADITDPEIKVIINKNQDRFKIKGSFAYISFEDLSKLNKKDLAVLRKNDLAGVTYMAVFFLCLILLHFGFNFAQVFIMEYTGQMIMHDLRIQLFTHIQSRSLSFFSHNPVGRLVTRVTNDIQNMHELFTSVVAFVFKDFFLLVGIAIVLLTINWQLALISFTVLPFVMYASIHFANQVRDAFRSLRIKIAQINTRFSETIEGIKVLQLFLQEKENYRSFAKLNHEHYLSGMKQINVFAVFMPVIELLGSIVLAVIIYFGGGRVVAENMSLGALVAYISYMKMFFRPIRDLAEKYNVMQNAMASAERIFIIMDSNEPDGQIRLNHTDDKKESINTTKKSDYEKPPFKKIREILFEDVSFEYIKNETVLNRISFKIDAGQSIAVVGPTGSGKTSLINLIPRFYDPTSGRILINGYDSKKTDIYFLRQKMALVTQEPFLFAGSIKANIAYGKNNLSKKEMDSIIEAANCKSFIDRLPHGVDTVLSKGGDSISSGERQLISMARAFARNPDVLILDEATSYIDSETETMIQQALFNLMKDRTSILVAHRLSTVRNVSRIIVLSKGKIIETGTHDQLMKQKGFYFRLHQLGI